MNGIGVFAGEIAASLIISALVLLRLKDLLRGVGNEVCDRQASAEFWITYLQLMMIIGPLLLIGYFSRAGAVPALGEVAQIKNSLLVVLSGHFISLAFVGRAVWKSMFAPSAGKGVPAAPVAGPVFPPKVSAMGGES